MDQGISFVALDACLEPGPKRPFNFFGVVRERDTEHLHTLIRAVEAGSSHSVWFGHYPTSCILSAGQGVSNTCRVNTLPGKPRVSWVVMKTWNFLCYPGKLGFVLIVSPVLQYSKIEFFNYEWYRLIAVPCIRVTDGNHSYLKKVKDCYKKCKR